MVNRKSIVKSVKPYLLLVVLSGVILTFGQIVTAEQTDEKSTLSAKRGSASHPHCGVYCLYTIMKLAGQQVDFLDLVKPEYIGSSKGSSFAELKKAAEDHKMHAEAVGKMTGSELRGCPYPVILHVKFDSKSKKYDHFELFLGEEEGKAKLFDPPLLPRLVPFHELASRWNGKGLVVSATPIDTGVIFAGARIRFMIYAALIAITVLAIRRVRQRLLSSTAKINWHVRLGYSAAQTIGLLVLTFLLGMTYNFVNEEGLLSQINSTTSIQQAHYSNFIPKVTKGKIEELLDTDAVFVDARLARDFEVGHLQGAINVPVDSNDTKRRQIMAYIDKNSRIILYCQSDRCRFAEEVALKLLTEGYSNLSIFKGGWNEWVAKSNN
jgi:rhodanese-related sulfurtransferase